MAKTNSAYKSLSIQQAIKFASEMETKTRVGLMEIISEEMYYKLCRLGIITEGATVDDKRNRIAVWRFTERAVLYDKIQNPDFTIDRLNNIDVLHKIGY